MDDIFQVNGIDLAEIQEGEVTVTNLYSSHGPNLILHLKFSQTGNIWSRIETRI